HVRRLVYEPPGVILDYGRKQRLFTGELRQAIQARDRQCAHDGKARCSYHHRNWKPRPG
ncbi:MAG: hypothetical protein ACI9MX_002936, partial [Candidatus Aldehydirespiratoraceae bacterium]